MADPAKSGVQPAPKEGDKVVVKIGEWARRDAPLTGVITSRTVMSRFPFCANSGQCLATGSS